MNRTARSILLARKRLITILGGDLGVRVREIAQKGKGPAMRRETICREAMALIVHETARIPREEQVAGSLKIRAYVRGASPRPKRALER